MPRNVRNFWIEANADGRATTATLGPASKEGGFDLTIWQRDASRINKVRCAVQIIGRAGPDGKIKLTVMDPDGNQLHTVQTDR